MGLKDEVDILDDVVSHELQLFEFFLDFSLDELEILEDLIVALSEVFHE